MDRPPRTRPTAHRPPPCSPSRALYRRQVRVNAESNEPESSIDWDKAWEGFKSGIKGTGAPTTRLIGDNDPVLRPTSFRANDPVQAKIRKQESFLVDVWSQPWFFYLMASLCLGVLLLLVHSMRL